MIQRRQSPQVVITVSAPITPLLQDCLAESGLGFSFSHVRGPVDVMEHKPLTTAYGTEKTALRFSTESLLSLKG